VQPFSLVPGLKGQRAYIFWALRNRNIFQPFVDAALVSLRNPMKINRAIGVALFLFLAHVLMGDVMRSISRTLIATLGTVETAAQTATIRLERTR
jgi:hypothetical protein